MITHEEIHVKGVSVKARLYLPDNKPQPFAGVVLCQGYKGKRKRYGLLARDLLSRGLAVLAFDARGSGESDGSGNESIADHFEDVLAAYDFLKGRPEVDQKRIGILGVSYGGYLASLLTEERPVASLLLDSPAIYEDAWWTRAVGNIANNDIQAFRHEGDLAGARVLKLLRRYSGPVRIVQHQLDEVVPARVVDAYVSATSQTSLREQIVLAGLGHSMTEDMAGKFSEIVCEWFADTLS